MCGRYGIARLTWKEVVDALELTGLTAPAFDLEPRYNIAPTQLAPVVLSDRHEHRCAMARFGLVPEWFNKPLEELKFATFNAKSEEIMEKASYRGPLKSQRCLIPVRFFYEWQGKGKPWLISQVDDRLFFMAGLWTAWRGFSKGQAVDFYSFTILTTVANDAMADIYKRMPVILPPEDYATWLMADVPDALRVIGQYPSQLLTLHRVGPDVGNVRNEGPQLAEPMTGTLI
ncbi:SOS response-associated peptidase [Pelagibius sp. Alg239-R121]|uniref:SOS response-associated peptidase n=1 Tax=Pelagibius sp. Alg239-R121 TaxID=2993448 RepID=UPI0024A68210|nr:SOS response-associated peptidase [Pelagibius sp. Alg239-R121]